MKQFILIVAAAAAFLFSSCTQDPTITVSPDVFTFTYEGGTQTAILSANGEWKAVPSDAAVTVSPADGAGDTPISITLSKNTTTAEKTYTVNFTCTVDGQSLSFPVTIKQGTDTPSIAIDPKAGTLDYKGGELTTSVTANFAWTATTECTELTITPTSGQAGTTSIKIVVPESAGDKELSHVITFDCEGAKQDYTITQTVAAAPEIVIEPKTMDFEYVASESQVTVTCNYSWTATADEGVTLSAASGESGDKVTIKVTENKSNDPREFKAVFVCEKNGNKAEETITIKQAGPEYLTYGDVKYKIKYLADGKLWMCENLRYVPEGKSISQDVTDDNGIWYSCGTDKKVQTDADSVAVKGLLYNTETAFGGVEITKDNFSSFEGVQGICPEGWHIPSASDLVNLVGKGVGELTDNTSAPYYDANKTKSSVALANADGFNIVTFGYRNQANVTGKGTYTGVLYNGKLTMDYIIGSSPRLKSGAPYYDPMSAADPTVKNIQYYSLMPFVNATNESTNVALFNFKSGGHVRCVRDSE